MRSRIQRRPRGASKSSPIGNPGIIGKEREGSAPGGDMAEMSIAGLPTTPRLSRSPMLAVAGVVVLFALKLGVLFTFGPTMMPDSAGYIAYAD